MLCKIEFGIARRASASFLGMLFIMTTPLSGLTWTSKTVTWAFASPGQVDGLGTVTSAISLSAQQAAVAAGIQEWAKVSGVNLVEVFEPSQADVQIGYGNPSGLIGECLWSYNPQTSHFSNALVLVKDPSLDPLATDANGNLVYSGWQTTLQQLATHEFGVALGLAEGNGSDPGSVMNHVQGPSNQVPDAADIAAIDSLYGPPATVSPDTLSLQLSEDAWRGNAQFVLKLDGQKIAGPTAVTALRSNGAAEVFNYSGNWGGGAHTVEIDFVNDAYGGTPAKDRNLYVDQVTFNGKPELSTPHAMYSNGAFVVHV